jgi:hypothetical protein
MSHAQEEMGSRPEERQTSPFGLALERSQLAQDLKQIYEDMCHTGMALFKVFCFEFLTRLKSTFGTLTNRKK